MLHGGHELEHMFVRKSDDPSLHEERDGVSQRKGLLAPVTLSFIRNSEMYILRIIYGRDNWKKTCTNAICHDQPMPTRLE